jgi:signal transduction histidine kinase/CheY-like chemotaxis protein
VPLFSRRSLFWKYAAYFGGLVSALLVVSGAVGGYFAYREAVAALEELQLARVHFSATKIADFMRDVQEALHATVTKFNTLGEVDVQDLRIELVSLLRHHPEISEMRWITAEGKERIFLSRFGLNATDRGYNWSDDPAFIGAHENSAFVGPVYFRKETEPHVVVAARDGAGSVLAVEVNLKHVWEVVSQPQLVPGGAAYVVDRAGQLISHPDLGLVLVKTDMSRLPHVRRTLDRAQTGTAVVGEARDVNGMRVVATAERIEGLGWTVFAEQSLDEAFLPAYASVARSVVLVLLGVTAAIAASLLLARSMVRPIREIETRARQLGEGDLQGRIALSTGDELEALAGQFNRMAAQLQQTHEMQELRIAARTRDLAVANAAKSRFLAVASHDLRQPLHALGLFVGQLHATKLPAAETALVERIERSAEALNELLDQLLDLSKLDVGALTAKPRPFALNDLLSRLAAQFAPSAEAKGLVVTAVPTSVWVTSDPLLLERILLNLIANALRYTVEGRILIGCRRRGEIVELLVADTGIGIDPEHLPHVFQEFYRAAPVDRGINTGLGLGLAIVKRLSLLLGHRVAITSTPGKGTIVRVHVARASPQRDAIAAPASVVDNLRGIRVLVIDDEESALDAMQGLLSQWGCDVVTARSGDEAVARVREGLPEVVLCDLNLQASESGIAVLERLRLECGLVGPCAYVTGESQPELIAAAQTSGHPIAFKPVTPGKLRALVEHLVRSR